MNKQYVKGKSLFTGINENYKQYKYLTQDISCDVLVVGGGVTGAILGHYFSKNNIDTVIIEKARIGHGSTGITTSLLQYELDDNAAVLKEFLREKDIVRAYELGLYAIDEIEQFANSCDIDFKFKRVDSLLYTTKSLEKKELYNEYEFRKENGFDVQFIDEENNPFEFDLAAGVLSKNGGAVIDPYLFTHGLLEESCKHGLRVFENTEALKINYEQDYVMVETIYGYTVTCKKLIVATGYNTTLFTKRNFGTKNTTFNIASQPIQQINDTFNKTVFRDNSDPYNYFRTTDDNRIIVGGADIGFDNDFENEILCSKSYSKLEQLMYRVLPNYKPRVEYKYCGAFASTQDNLGFVGTDPKRKNLWYCLGYGANGILFAILGGKFLSKLYLGEEQEDMKLFRINRFDN